MGVALAGLVFGISKRRRCRFGSRAFAHVPIIGNWAIRGTEEQVLAILVDKGLSNGERKDSS